MSAPTAKSDQSGPSRPIPADAIQGGRQESKCNPIDNHTKVEKKMMPRWWMMIDAMDQHVGQRI